MSSTEDIGSEHENFALAHKFLEDAREHASYPQASEHQVTFALIGVGYALLTIAELLEERPS